MSVTTIDNPVTSTLRSTLQDYEIHLTGAEIKNGTIDTSLNYSQTSTPVQNPHHWLRDHHRIPNYRPINRNLDAAERPNGVNPIEHAFIIFMFTGVVLNSTMAQTWGSTGGKVFTKVFRYAIGGEW